METENISVEEINYDASSNSAATNTESSTSTNILKHLQRIQVKSFLHCQQRDLRLVPFFVATGLFYSFFDASFICLACSYLYVDHGDDPKAAHERERPQCAFVRNKYYGLAYHLLAKLEQRCDSNDSQTTDAFSTLIESTDDRLFSNEDFRSFYRWARGENPLQNDEISNVFRRITCGENSLLRFDS